MSVFTGLVHTGAFHFGGGEGSLSQSHTLLWRNVETVHRTVSLSQSKALLPFLVRLPYFNIKSTCFHRCFPYWWRRGESNPCPKIYSHIFLRVHSVYCVSEQRCRQTGCAIRIALSHDCYKRQFTVHVHRSLTPYPKPR